MHSENGFTQQSSQSEPQESAMPKNNIELSVEQQETRQQVSEWVLEVIEKSPNWEILEYKETDGARTDGMPFEYFRVQYGKTVLGVPGVRRTKRGDTGVSVYLFDHYPIQVEGVRPAVDAPAYYSFAETPNVMDLFPLKLYGDERQLEQQELLKQLDVRKPEITFRRRSLQTPTTE